MKGILKKASILLSLLLVFAFVAPFVLGTPSLSVNTSKLILDEETGSDISKDIIITNTGTENLTNIHLSPINFSDGDNLITVTFTPSTPFNLNVSESKTVNIKATIPSDMVLDNYEGTVTVFGTNLTADDVTTTFTLRVDVIPSEVGDICEKGRIGTDDLEISDVKDPDDGEDFKPLEKIKVKTKVRNHASKDWDVEFSAFLIDKEDDDVLADVEDIAEIEKYDDLTFDLNLEVPADIEEESSTRYAVYVVANKENDEEEYCDWQKVDIEIEKDSDAVLVTDIEPAEFVCGTTNDVFVEIVNAGTNDQDEVEIRLAGFGISQSKTIDDFDKGDDESILFSLDIPKDTEAGTHDIEVITIDEDGDQNDRKIFPVNIICEAPKPSATLSLMQSSFVARQGSSISTTAVIINTGDADETFTLKVTPIGTWSDAIENTFTLAKGETKSVPLSLPVKQEGSHSAKVEVLADDKVLTTQTISVSATSIETMPVTAGVVGVAKEQMALFIIISVLALAVIVLIIWLIFLYAKKGSVVSISSGSKELRRVKEAVRGKSRRR